MDSSLRQDLSPAVDNGDSTGTGAADLTCRVCQRKFSRPEHLKRHGQVHIQSKPYKCKHCNKAFARKDAAKRHQNVHEYAMPTAEAVSGTLARASPGTRRTCSTCTRNLNHSRCSGSMPCNYCAPRNLECSYPPKKRIRMSSVQHEDVQHADTLASFEVSRPGRVSSSASIRADADDGHTQPQLVVDGLNTDLPCLDTLRDVRDQTIDRVDSASSGGRLPTFLPISNATGINPSSAHRQEVVISPDQHLQDLTSINWLPFDFSSIGSITSPTTDENGNRDDTVPNEVVLSHMEDHVMPDSGHDRSSMLRHDRVSELIHSMRSCLPGQVSIVEGSEMLDVISGQQYHGSLYSNGAGSRMSQSDRRILARRPSHSFTDGSSANSMTGEDSWISVLQKKVQFASRDSFSNFQMPGDVHLELLSKVCPSSGSVLSNDYAINKDILLSRNTLDFMIQLYFTHFHKVYPFLDQSLLCISVWGWALCIAAAAIGARYLDIDELTTFGDHLCSVVHRLLLQELDFGLVEDSLPYIQARALAAVGMCHSHHRSLINCGYSTATLLFESCLRLRLLEEDERIGALQSGQNLEQVWIAWRFRETRRRTGIFIWLLDSTLTFTTRLPPKIPLEHLNLILPSADDLWNAESYQEWLEIRRRKQSCDYSTIAFGIEEKSRLRAQDAEEDLRINLKKPDSVTEFATTVIIHMLICRTWDMSRCLDASFPVNIPCTSGAPGVQRTRPLVARYLGTVPEFSRWRNATCDHLDVLHWKALSQSASIGGLEGPVFLQLHLARLCILTPAKELLSHVRVAATSNSNFILPNELYSTPETMSACRQIIVIWASKDRYKARLALIHAGAIFWHVRRYSSDVFVQPFAVFLAAITLWAFGTFSSPRQTRADVATEITGEEIATSPNASHSGMPSYDETVRLRPVPLRRMPSLMQLDRPMDDELVQHFIRRGDEMRLYLEGVPDMCSPKGPSQILHEAILLLEELTTIWSISKNYSHCLTAVLHHTA